MNEEREKNFFMFDLFQMPLQFSSVYKVFIKERNDYWSRPTCDHAIIENYLTVNYFVNVILEIKFFSNDHPLRYYNDHKFVKLSI